MVGIKKLELRFKLLKQRSRPNIYCNQCHHSPQPHVQLQQAAVFDTNALINLQYLLSLSIVMFGFFGILLLYCARSV